MWDYFNVGTWFLIKFLVHEPFWKGKKKKIQDKKKLMIELLFFIFIAFSCLTGVIGSKCQLNMC